LIFSAGDVSSGLFPFGDDDGKSRLSRLLIADDNVVVSAVVVPKNCSIWKSWVARFER